MAVRNRFWCMIRGLGDPTPTKNQGLQVGQSRFHREQGLRLRKIVDFGEWVYGSPKLYLMCDQRVGRPNPYEESGVCART